MSWIRRYRIRQYWSDSLWILPVLGILVALAAVRLVYWIDLQTGWKAGFQPEAARLILGTLSASMFTFIVFVSSALLVTVQLASTQLTPRIIGLVFKEPVTRFSLTLFVFTFTFTLAVLLRIEDNVPLLSARLAGYSCVLSLGVFLYLIDHVGKTVRPSVALRRVALLGRQVVEMVYPQPFSPEEQTSATGHVSSGPFRTVASRDHGVVQAFDTAGLVSLAAQADCLVEVVPQVGDFVAAGQPLFRLYPANATVAEQALLQAIAIGWERTLEGSPALAFRILVDVACKALSPGINDPTTAVLALDELHHLLGQVGRRRLDTGQVCDNAGRLRLVYRTPDWEDFVHLAVTEIRHFGGGSLQINRRLRAMLEDLIQTLPAERGGLLRQELELLHRSAERRFSDPEDVALADVSDLQGVGSKSASPPADGRNAP